MNAREKLVLTEAEVGAFETLVALSKKINNSVFINISEIFKGRIYYVLGCAPSKSSLEEAVESFNNYDPLVEKRKLADKKRAELEKLEEEIKTAEAA